MDEKNGKERLEELERRLATLEELLAERKAPKPFESFFASLVATYVSMTLIAIIFAIGVGLVLLFLLWCCPGTLERWLPG